MAVPTLITDLSTTPASNSPAGSENVFPNLDDYLRAQSAFLASVRDNSGNGWVSPYLPTAGGTMTGTVAGLSASSLNGGQLAGLRNRIINGDMRIDQRQNGGSITITGAGVYTVDRSFSVATGANLTGNRTTTGTSSFGCTRAAQFIGAASNTAAQLGQRIEAANIQDFDTGTTITISCYIYSSAAFTPTWQWITATTTDATYATVGASGSFAAVPATTWTRVTATFAAPANTTNGAQVSILLGATLAGVTKLVTGLQVEIGAVATPFEQRPIGMELALCQRYYQIINSIRIAGYATAAAEIAAPVGYMAAMRTNPTATVGTFTLVNVATATVYAQNMGTNGGSVRIIAGATGGLSAIDGQFTLSAEL